MKHKADLQSVRALILAKKSLQRECLDLYHGKSGAGYSNAGKPSKGMTPESSVERTFLNIGDQADQVNWKLDWIRKAIDNRMIDIWAAIGNIGNWKYREILMQRYIYALPWKVISQNMRYERRYLMKLHYQALLSYEREAEAVAIAQRIAVLLNKPVALPDGLPQDQDAK